VADSLVQRIKMEKVREYVGRLAQTNYYLTNIPLSTKLKEHFQSSYKDLGNIDDFVKYKLGYLCSEATLPTTSFATAEVKDNFMGIPQEFAHTRLYTDIDLTYYVDSDYSILRFFEGWMDYIAGGNFKRPNNFGANDLTEPAAGTDLSPKIYRRFNFPDDYKIQNMQIIKFERDFDKMLEYTFVNAFPKGITSMPVSYGPADLLKVTITFNFDRYVVTRRQLQQETTGQPATPQQTSSPQEEVKKPESSEEIQARLRKERTLLINSGESVFNRDPSPRARSQNR